MAIKRVALQDLTVGMYIERFDGAWIDHPFWRSGFVVKSVDDLARIHESKISGVWIDTARGVAPPVPSDDAAAPARAAPPAEPEAKLEPADCAATPTASHGEPARRREPTSLHDELSSAASLCRVAKTSITSIFEQARMGHLGDSETARELVEQISDSVMRNPVALVSLARLKTADTYTYLHSVAVCALMVALAGQLRLDETQTRAAGMAGLMHDVGKAAVPLDVLNKPGKLSDAEFALIKRHPECGHDMLLASGNLRGEALDACLHHHERIDGTGYPHRLRGKQIGLLARMAAICDVYDAVSSDRPYKKAWDPAEAIRRMAEWTDTHLDKTLFQAFVKSIGIYPVGSLVRLSSDRLGVVVEPSESLMAPRVKVFYSIKARLRIPPEVVDLHKAAQEKIVAREDPQKWGFPDLEELWSGFASRPW